MVALEDASSIQVSRRLREKLAALGVKGETYENIIWKLIELACGVRRQLNE
mgnify:FL=1